MHPNWHVDHMTMSMTSNCLTARHKHLWLGFRGREKEADLSISVNSWYSRLQSLQKTPLPPKIRHNHLLQQHLTRILKATWTLSPITLEQIEVPTSFLAHACQHIWRDCKVPSPISPWLLFMTSTATGVGFRTTCLCFTQHMYLWNCGENSTTLSR
jgi:hypothetical protein